MPRFAANLTLMFNEVPFLERFGRAARAGFTGVECLFPYAWPAAQLAEAKRAAADAAANTTALRSANDEQGRQISQLRKELEAARTSAARASAAAPAAAPAAQATATAPAPTAKAAAPKAASPAKAVPAKAAAAVPAKAAASRFLACWGSKHSLIIPVPFLSSDVHPPTVTDMMPSRGPLPSSDVHISHLK
jgi:hydroxypyruvate isomerase